MVEKQNLNWVVHNFKGFSSNGGGGGSGSSSSMNARFLVEQYL